MKTILVTGGLGYIGSHAVVALLQKNFNVIIIDDLSNSDIKIIQQIEAITHKLPKVYIDKLQNTKILSEIFSNNPIDAVMHFAAYKSVAQSVINPLQYYENNVGGGINLLDIMQKFNVKIFVYSSSATVYGIPENVPIKETSTLKPINPYGQTKLVFEQILTDMYCAENLSGVAILRYFNPIGAHPSGLIGENPIGIPNNLMPYITQVATKKLSVLKIFGNDYNTIDGTGVRDYIHVMDLVNGHVLALNYILEKNELVKLNLGTGKGSSVLELVHTFETVTHQKINYKFFPKRNGDVEKSFADVTLAKKILNFTTQYTLEDMCRDSWNFQKNII